jgi:hypothetical protein
LRAGEFETLLLFNCKSLLSEVNHLRDNVNEIRQLIIRVPKDQAAFTYFQLEANEGLFFYSTLDKSLKEFYRDLLLTCHLTLEAEGQHFLDYLKNEVEYLVISDEKK